MVGPVQAARRSVDSFQEVRPPDWGADAERPCRAAGPSQRAPLEHADLQPDAVLRALVTLLLDWVEEVEVADDDADPVEPEQLQHEPSRTPANRCCHPGFRRADTPERPPGRRLALAR